MGDAPSISNTAFADALARARQLAAKLSSNAPPSTSPPQQMPVGIKRSAGSIGSNDSEPDTKRLASLNDPFGAQLAAMKHGGGGGGIGIGGGPPNIPFTFPVGLGITGSGKSCMEEVRIPDGLVGLSNIFSLIGRGGEQVSRIQAETGCKVQVAPDSAGGKDRPCYLQGTKESIEKAKELIMEIVNSKSHEISRPGLGATKPGLSAAMQGGPGTASIEMTIPGAKVGLVIGKGGETIRNLQDKSGTKMYILQENMFEECDKPLRIVGEPDLVEHARQLVMDLINDTPPKSEFFKIKNEYGDRDGGGPGGMGGGPPGGRSGLGFGSLETMKFPVPKISVGLIIGKGGEMIKKIQQETGAKVQFDPVNQNLGDMDEQLAIITGKPDQLRLAQLKIEELVETALHGPTTRGGPGGPGGGHGGDRRNNDSWGGGGGGHGPPGGHNNRRGDQDEERMPVPVGRVGMVIGKGGETIRTINQQSGAHCEIDRNGPSDGPERIFVIRGSRQQIEHAKSLIMDKVNTLPPKGNSNGPGGHDSGYGGHNQGGGGGWGQPGYQSQGQSQGWGQGGQSSGGQGAPGGGGDAQAQWAAYYAQYYSQAQTPAAGAGATAAASAAGQTDYTQQWIEYLRAQGQHQQADLLEKQMKAGGATNGSASGASSAPEPPGTAASAGPTGGGVPGQNGSAAGGDYSQQWADHYRAIGKVAEAEAIENYIKTQKSGGAQPSAAGGAAPVAGGDPAAYQNYYNQYYQQYYGAAGYGGAAGGAAPAGYGAAGAQGGYSYPGASGASPPAPPGSQSSAPPGTEGDK